MFGKSKRFWTILGLCVLVFVFYFPSLVAYRYTASSQNTSFLTHPWRSWQFAYAAFTVAGDSALKTSGAAFRHGEEVFRDSNVRVEQARLLFVRANRPYRFRPFLDGHGAPVEVTPPYRFVWQIEGNLRMTGGGGSDERQDVVVALFDYRSGRTLYDVRLDMPSGSGR